MSADPCVRVSPLAPVVTPSTCADGEVTAAVLTPQGPPGVVYSFDPAGTVGLVGRLVVRPVGVTSVTVTATLTVAECRTGGVPLPTVVVAGSIGGDDGDVDGAVDGGVVHGDAAGGDVRGPPQCVAGVATPWTVTPVTVDGVTYVLDPAGGVDRGLGSVGDGDGDVGGRGGRLGSAPLPPVVVAG